jgi:hypothetical protein
MCEQSTSEFEELRRKPIFAEVMRQAPRNAAQVEAVFVSVLASVLEVCEQEKLTPDQTYWLLEVHARAVLGAQIALYLDRMINPDEREQMKKYLLAAADAISMLRKGPTG